MSTLAPPPLVTRRLLSARALAHFYRRRLRAHGMQELLAAVGIAAAVALVLAAVLAQGSITSSTRQALRAVLGPADLQLRARGPQGFPEELLGQVEAIPGVARAAPLLERSVRIIGPGGTEADAYIAGTDATLGVLNGLGRTLPLTAFDPGTVALSETTASALALSRAGEGVRVALLVGGVRHLVPVSALLGSETIGAPLAGALVGVMPLATMQSLLGTPGRVTRILVQSRHGAHARVLAALRRLAGARLIAAGSEQDVEQLQQALHPSVQASTLFAVIGALLGLLFAFNAILLTVPERRQAIADLRLAGTRRSAIVQLVSFQAICLGAVASAVGVGLGYVLSRWVFSESTGYLAEAFTLSGGTTVRVGPVVLVAIGGVLATWLASALPLADLRRGTARDEIYVRPGVPGNALTRRVEFWTGGAALACIAAASALFAAAPSGALAASVALALATVLAVPCVFALALALARAASERAPRLTTLALALRGVRATTVRALALAAIGAVALFGSVALGGARSNLLEGIGGFARSYAADAPVWVGAPGDYQATQPLQAQDVERALARVPGVASVSAFRGGFLTLGARRVWVLARSPGGARHVLESQTIGGANVARRAQALLARGGWIVLSGQIAAERHVRVGGTLVLPTPSGGVPYRIAALSTNLAWSPGVVFMDSADFARAWQLAPPTALAVHPAAGATAAAVAQRIARALGPDSGLEVTSATHREAQIDNLTAEGLSQLGLVSNLLVLTAILSLAAALASSVNQRRAALAGLRLAGAPPARLRRMIVAEASLMLAGGCLAGALAGVYGQVIIDAYLRHVTAFPVAPAVAGARPLVVLVLVVAAALAIAAIPGWLASRVSPALALAEE